MICKTHLWALLFKSLPEGSAAQKPQSWVAQRTTHGESLVGPYFFLAGPWLLLYVPTSVMPKHAQIDVIRPSS